MSYAERYRRTPNASNGRNERLGVVFHHTGGSYAGAVAWLCDPRSSASAHVVIAKDGHRTVLASDDLITWHAGRSEFRERQWCNTFMMGVEFELFTEDEQLTDAQIESALEWLAPRWERYGWSIEWMTHHREVAPGRKVDLSELNWAHLRRRIEERFCRRGADRVSADLQTSPGAPPVLLPSPSIPTEPRQ